ncbi:MAG: sulfite exporter TauE/SafE family protein [Oscillospiraceae bacterium]|nr:sulfite exporter TauE/SafE family protein [Oscillospiraceae bacterium]
MTAIIAGLLAGALSSWGVGGGALLVLYLTMFSSVPQSAAQGINLLYFLPVAAGALLRYIRRGLIEFPVLWPAALSGLLTAGAAAYLSRFAGDTLLRPAFGGLLIVMGVRELWVSFRQNEKNEGDEPPRTV